MGAEKQLLPRKVGVERKLLPRKVGAHAFLPSFFLSFFSFIISIIFSGRYEQLLASANQANVQQRFIVLPWGFRAWFVENETVSGSEAANQDAVTLSVLRGLLLPVREALQKGRGTFNANNNIEGPLTWRYFKTVEIQT